ETCVDSGRGSYCAQPHSARSARRWSRRAPDSALCEPCWRVEPGFPRSTAALCRTGRSAAGYHYCRALGASMTREETTMRGLLVRICGAMICSAAMILPASARSQAATPDSSVAMVGTTLISVHYVAPLVGGREVFGSVVPYKQ